MENLTKKQVIYIILILIIGTTLSLFYLGKNPLPLLFIGLLIAFLIYALWNPPKKHKSFSYSDQQKAMNRCVGGAPELPVPGRSKKIKKKK